MKTKVYAVALGWWQTTYRDYDANPWVQVARIERNET